MYSHATKEAKMETMSKTNLDAGLVMWIPVRAPGAVGTYVIMVTRNGFWRPAAWKKYCCKG